MPDNHKPLPGTLKRLSIPSCAEAVYPGVSITAKSITWKPEQERPVGPRALQAQQPAKRGYAGFGNDVRNSALGVTAGLRRVPRWPQSETPDALSPPKRRQHTVIRLIRVRVLSFLKLPYLASPEETYLWHEVPENLVDGMREDPSPRNVGKIPQSWN